MSPLQASQDGPEGHDISWPPMRDLRDAALQLGPRRKAFLGLVFIVMETDPSRSGSSEQVKVALTCDGIGGESPSDRYPIQQPVANLLVEPPHSQTSPCSFL